LSDEQALRFAGRLADVERSVDVLFATSLFA
jgi:hypothetical protein